LQLLEVILMLLFLLVKFQFISITLRQKMVLKYKIELKIFSIAILNLNNVTLDDLKETIEL